MLYVARVFVVVVVLGSETDGAFDFHYLWHAVVRAIAYRDNTCIYACQVIRAGFVYLFKRWMMLHEIIIEFFVVDYSILSSSIFYGFLVVFWGGISR